MHTNSDQTQLEGGAAYFKAQGPKARKGARKKRIDNLFF